MEITPFYHDEQLSVSSVVVRVNKQDQERVAELVKRTGQVGTVTDEPTFQRAKRAAGELKALTNEIADSKRAAKRPFEAVLSAIEELAKEVVAPVANEQKRILDSLNGYVRRLEIEAKEAERKRLEELDRQERAHQTKMREMEQAKRKAEEALRKAQGEAEREQAKMEAARKALALAQSIVERELELEVAAMNQESKKGLVPGGRVTHPFKFNLVNPEETVKAGCIRLLRIELNVLNCQDSCKAQLEIDPNKIPVLPGIVVTREISVTVKAASRIS